MIKHSSTGPHGHASASPNTFDHQTHNKNRAIDKPKLPCTSHTTPTIINLSKIIYEDVKRTIGIINQYKRKDKTNQVQHNQHTILLLK